MKEFLGEVSIPFLSGPSLHYYTDYSNTEKEIFVSIPFLSGPSLHYNHVTFPWSRNIMFQSPSYRGRLCI